MTPRQRALVQDTIPLLETSGEALTRHFYAMMLEEYPQVRPLFNQAHQASGEQQRALAYGILMYARHLDNLDDIGPLVGRIVNKHVALQILPEHYPIVGACLLRAIAEVLSDAATDELIEAWAVAYGRLSEALIGAEERLYAANEQAPGGWRGARRFRVAAKVIESEEITSFHFVPEDGGAVLRHRPGQYTCILLELDGVPLRRNYSLSAPSDGTGYRISVKREPGGRVSNHLHDQVQVGDPVDLFAPAGEFVLRDSDKPVVLITAGVGITPSLPMLEAACGQGREIHFIHCARHGGVHAFREWVERMAAEYPRLRHHFCYSEPRAQDRYHAAGLLGRHHLEEWLPVDRDLDAYFLGPRPFMAQVRKYLGQLGVPAAQCHFEFFGPFSELEA